MLKLTSIYLPLLFLILHSWFCASRDDVAGSNNNTNNNNNSSGTGNIRRFPASGQHHCRRWRLVAAAVSAFSLAIGLSEGTTVLLKLYVRRRRPNFYALCGLAVDAGNDNNRPGAAGTARCTAETDHVVEGNLSFPSGHSSLVACGMAFLVWYLHGWSMTASASRRRQRVGISAMLLHTCLPLGWALFVGASRLADHWHHPSDVVAGLILGVLAATVAYNHFYPPVWSSGEFVVPGVPWETPS